MCVCIYIYIYIYILISQNINLWKTLEHPCTQKQQLVFKGFPDNKLLTNKDRHVHKP